MISKNSFHGSKKNKKKLVWICRRFEWHYNAVQFIKNSKYILSSDIVDPWEIITSSFQLLLFQKMDEIKID